MLLGNRVDGRADDFLSVVLGLGSRVRLNNLSSRKKDELQVNLTTPEIFIYIVNHLVSARRALTTRCRTVRTTVVANTKYINEWSKYHGSDFVDDVG